MRSCGHVAAGARAHVAQQLGAEQEGGRVERERLAGADGEDQRGAQRRPDEDGQVLGRRGQRPGVLDLCASGIVWGSRPV